MIYDFSNYFLTKWGKRYFGKNIGNRNNQIEI